MSRRSPPTHPILRLPAVALTVALLTACDDLTGPKPRFGAVRIAVATTGVDLDPNGYQVRVDTQVPRDIALTGAIVVTGMPVGGHIVSLLGRAPNCAALNYRQVLVVADDTVDAEFSVTCLANRGALRLVTSTTGNDLDGDGYTLTVDSGTPFPVAPVSATSIEGLPVGQHSVAISGIAANCALLQTNPVARNVEFGAESEIIFPIQCRWRPGGLRVIVATSGDSIDADGYSLVLTGVSGRTVGIATNATISLDSLEVGSYDVRLDGVARNCRITGSRNRAETVVSRQTIDVSFAVVCTKLADLRLTVATQGEDADWNGYQVFVAGADFYDSLTIASTGAHTFEALFPGEYTVDLSGITLNCEPADSLHRTVQLTGGATTNASLQVTCTRATQLAYWTDVPGGAALHTVMANGTSATKLALSVGNNVEPSWSPDGTKIVFRSDRDGNNEIYVLDLAGPGAVQRLTTNAADDYDPAWSPDGGSKIAFVSDRTGSGDIYVMNADGSNLVRLTSDSALDAEPDWSPDGSKIVFRSDRSGDAELYVMNADGSGVTRLTNHSGFDGQPAWSPDGAKIAFAREVPCDDYYYCYYYSRNNVAVMNADGSNVTLLSSDADESQPTWSPDGQWIALVAWQCGYYDCSYAALVAVKSDDTRRAEILVGGFGNPAWRRNP